MCKEVSIVEVRRQLLGVDSFLPSFIQVFEIEVRSAGYVASESHWL